MKRFFSSLAIGAIGGAAALSFLSACSDDGTKKGSTTGGNETADAGAWNNQYSVPHIDAGPIPPFTDYTKIKDPWPDDTEASCNAGGDEYLVNRACLCADPTCRELMHQCDALESCIEIRHCIWEVGCTDPNSCYLLKSPGDKTGCVDIIDKWGNTGDGVAIANTALQCGQKLATPCPQPPQ